MAKQTQERIRLEAEAIKFILEQSQEHRLHIISSEVVADEIESISKYEKRRRVFELFLRADEHIIIEDGMLIRVNWFVEHGLGAMDALHLAVAEANRVDVCINYRR